MFPKLFSWATVCLSLSSIAIGAPIQKRAPRIALHLDFPDPSFVQADGGTWYAFGTNGNGKTIQVARSEDFQSWELLDKDALPTTAPWETKKDHWAPDVIRRKDGKYVMYYSGEAKEMVRHHCVGVAVSEGTDPTGPYIPRDQPLSCRLDKGGSIDPAGFQDKDGSRYVVFKVDGNSVGHGGDCNNGVEPKVGTPLTLQKVQEDGFTPIGDAVSLLDRSDADGDGPLLEAPSLVLHGDTYFLFYSTHCFTDPKYDVRYATSKSITGPYKKQGSAQNPLLNGPNSGLTSPGGATVCGCGDRMVFHAFCEKDQRCMYAADMRINGDQVSIL